MYRLLLLTGIPATAVGMAATQSPHPATSIAGGLVAGAAAVAAAVAVVMRLMGPRRAPAPTACPVAGREAEFGRLVAQATAREQANAEILRQLGTLQATVERHTEAIHDRITMVSERVARMEGAKADG